MRIGWNMIRLSFESRNRLPSGQSADIVRIQHLIGNMSERREMRISHRTGQRLPHRKSSLVVGFLPGD